jgi:hypothetical protein
MRPIKLGLLIHVLRAKVLAFNYCFICLIRPVFFEDACRHPIPSP